MKRVSKIMFTDNQGRELIEITGSGQLHFIKAFYNADEIPELSKAVMACADELRKAVEQPAEAVEA